MTYEDVLVALADSTRRSIFELLREKKFTVAEIAAMQPVSRPAVSQHLKILRDAGLVNVEADGTRRYYHIRREGLGALREYLDSFWSDILEAYASEIEKHKGMEDDKTSG